VGRCVIINETSNTISLFHRLRSKSLLARQYDIPLRYHGVPVIPYHFPGSRSVDPPTPATPSELQDSVALPRVDGLSNAQLYRLLSFIPGVIETIDFYLDRSVLITMDYTSFLAAREKVGADFFSAWGCVFAFTLYTSLGSERSKMPTRRDKILPNSRETGPGSEIYNRAGTMSTFGPFLSRKSPSTLPTHDTDLFVVSAHSFLMKQKVCVGFSPLALFILASVIYLAIVATSSELFPTPLLKQLFVVRTGVFLQDCLWKYLGRIFGYHNMVTPFRPILTRQSGMLRIERSSPMFSFDIYLLVPMLPSLFLRWIEHRAPEVHLLTRRFTCLPVDWSAWIEAIFTVTWIFWTNEFYREEPLVRRFFSQDLLSSNGTVWSFWSDFDILAHQFPVSFRCFLFYVRYWSHLHTPHSSLPRSPGHSDVWIDDLVLGHISALLEFQPSLHISSRRPTYRY
jgi:hypothetical protein